MLECLLLAYLFLVYIHNVVSLGPQARDKMIHISITWMLMEYFRNNRNYSVIFAEK